jgi:hypothetical protein
MSDFDDDIDDDAIDAEIAIKYMDELFALRGIVLDKLREKMRIHAKVETWFVEPPTLTIDKYVPKKTNDEIFTSGRQKWIEAALLGEETKSSDSDASDDPQSASSDDDAPTSPPPKKRKGEDDQPDEKKKAKNLKDARNKQIKKDCADIVAQVLENLNVKKNEEATCNAVDYNVIKAQLKQANDKNKNRNFMKEKGYNPNKRLSAADESELQTYKQKKTDEMFLSEPKPYLAILCKINAAYAKKECLAEMDDFLDGMGASQKDAFTKHPDIEKRFHFFKKYVHYKFEIQYDAALKSISKHLKCSTKDDIKSKVKYMAECYENYRQLIRMSARFVSTKTVQQDYAKKIYEEEDSMVDHYNESVRQKEKKKKRRASKKTGSDSISD